MTLDPVTAAARRQHVLDEWAEMIDDRDHGIGMPPDRLALQLLDVALAAGYELPVHDSGPPLAGRGSSEAGRIRAQVILNRTRAGCRCPGDRSVDLADHLDTCPIRR